jgi:hypothetical protein
MHDCAEGLKIYPLISYTSQVTEEYYIAPVQISQ